MKRGGGRSPFASERLAPSVSTGKRTHVSCDTVQSFNCLGCQLVTADEDESHLEGIRLFSQAQIRRYYELLTILDRYLTVESASSRIVTAVAA